MNTNDILCEKLSQQYEIRDKLQLARKLAKIKYENDIIKEQMEMF